MPPQCCYGRVSCNHQSQQTASDRTSSTRPWSGGAKPSPPQTSMRDSGEPIVPTAADSMPPAGAPAYAILETCRHYGVALAIDNDECLVVGKAGAKAVEATQPWPSLVMALEAHCHNVAALVKAGWHLRSFP